MSETTTSKSNSTDTEPDHYFDEMTDVRKELEYQRTKINDNLRTLEHIHDRLETIDCDVGTATLTFDDTTLQATMNVPDFSGHQDALIKAHDWDDLDIEYDADLELYVVSLELSLPYFERLEEIET